ncbi:MAG: hypothetical protein AB8G23_01410 [Myxococcota bacterium]
MSRNRVTTHRSFTSYIDRTREFYKAQGYEEPYRWASFDEVPFTALASLGKPLAESRLALITTASPWDCQETRALRGEREVWSGETSEPPARLFTDHLSWDKENTHTNDLASFVPIERMKEQVEAGRLGSLAPRFHGVPTDYSQRATLEKDAPEILARCRKDQVDIALLVPL